MAEFNNKLLKNKSIKETALVLPYRSQAHPFHIVDPSPWPFLTAFSAFTFVTGVAMYMHYYSKGFAFLLLGLVLLIVNATFWWRDVIREATFEGHHTSYVKNGLKMGMALFIVSEVMLFFAFFWGFFHSSLNPTLELGSVWPPMGIIPMSPWGIPLLNTFILLTSGATVTWAHYSLIAGYRNEVLYALYHTIGLASIFTLFQLYEYVNATFSISDGVYGSTFYSTTGLHGLHVLVGTLFLTVCLVRHIQNHFTRSHHLGFECAIWYWHFVDVVWIFLFIFVYWWGSSVK